MSKRFVRAGALSDIPPGSMLAVDVDGVALAICNVNGDLFAVQDECTHECYPLTEGTLQGHVLTCTLHGASFDVRSGEVLDPPAYEPVSTYEVKVDGDDVLVAID